MLFFAYIIMFLIYMIKDGAKRAQRLLNRRFKCH